MGQTLLFLLIIANDFWYHQSLYFSIQRKWLNSKAQNRICWKSICTNNPGWIFHEIFTPIACMEMFRTILTLISWKNGAAIVVVGIFKLTLYMEEPEAYGPYIPKHSWKLKLTWQLPSPFTFFSSRSYNSSLKNTKHV